MTEVKIVPKRELYICPNDKMIGTLKHTAWSQTFKFKKTFPFIKLGWHNHLRIKYISVEK